MAGKAVLPAEFSFFGGNKLIYGIRGHGASGVVLVGEQKSPWPAGMEPVLCQDIQGIPGKDGIPVRTGFGMTDMYAHGRTADILIAERADLTNPEPGRIQERQDRLVLKIGKRLDKKPDLFLCTQDKDRLKIYMK